MWKTDVCRALIILIASVALFCAPESRAEDAVEAAPPPAPATSATPERDPFWPPGYTPRAVLEEITQQQQSLKIEAQAQALVEWPVLVLAGITRTGDKNIGLIQGVGLVENGDIVRMTKDGVLYKWRIEEVSENGLSCKRISATPIPLTNPRGPVSGTP